MNVTVTVWTGPQQTETTFDRDQVTPTSNRFKRQSGTYGAVRESWKLVFEFPDDVTPTSYVARGDYIEVTVSSDPQSVGVYHQEDNRDDSTNVTTLWMEVTRVRDDGSVVCETEDGVDEIKEVLN